MLAKASWGTPLEFTHKFIIQFCVNC